MIIEVVLQLRAEGSLYHTCRSST